jgi:ABC-type polysaccharide transport system permease subunit
MASAIPLNNFRTIISNIITNANTVYTAPAGVTTVVLMAQVANVNPTQTVRVSASHIRGANNTRLIANAEIPIRDAASLLMGKLVLESGDGFSIQANLNDSAELSLSILETANA